MYLRITTFEQEITFDGRDGEEYIINKINLKVT